MGFTPIVRVRNFDAKYLAAYISMYPDVMYDTSWNTAAKKLEEEMPRYKKSYYQQACQLGIEDRSDPNHFRYHVYLETFEYENLKRYMEFWFKIYYAPNPYTDNPDNEKPGILFCEFANKILQSSTLSIDFHAVMQEICGSLGSSDILFNCFGKLGEPIRCHVDEIKEEKKKSYQLYINPSDKAQLESLVKFIQSEFPVPALNNRKNFYDRFSFSNFNKFWGINGNKYNESAELVHDPNLDLYKNSSNRIKGGENVILYGVPGAGKSYKIATEYCNNDSYYERVVFHPDYTYSDFVGQILPKVVVRRDEKSEQGSPDGQSDSLQRKISYEFTPGPFTKIMKKAWHDPFHKYFLIIEELNRGNAPAIFGDIFQLLDRNSDGWGEFKIYNSDISHAIFPDEEQDVPVQIPSNLTILATMNTSDQNVFTLDNAFQRRWKMRLIHNNFNKNGNEKHDIHIVHEIKDTGIRWGDFAKLINSRIAQDTKEMIGSEDKRLGVFFVTDSELDNREDFAEKVLKYLWDDAFKMDRSSVFNEKFATFEDLIDAYLLATGNPLKEVLVQELFNGMSLPETETSNS